MPVGGVEYPRELVEFAGWFPDDEACADYLAWLRWGDFGFICRRCGAIGHGWPRAGGMVYDCGACHSTSSMTAGTIFDKTRTPLTVWFRAAWEMTARTTGVSARNLQRTVGLGSYQTAWSMLHRFRRAMVVPGRARLSGVVEVDETTIGGRNKKGKPGRSKDPNKTPVIVMTENRGKSGAGGTGKGLGRTRAVVLPDYGADTIKAILRENVEPDTKIVSDAYSSLVSAMRDYEHTPINVKRSGTPAHLLFPAVSRAQAQLKRWLAGTMQGAVSPEHLQEYLWEFEFRFNRRTARKPGLLFYRLIEQAAITDPVRYTDLITPGSQPRDVHPTPPPGPRSWPRSLDQPDAGRPWREVVR